MELNLFVPNGSPIKITSTSTSTEIIIGSDPEGPEDSEVINDPVDNPIETSVDNNPIETSVDNNPIETSVDNKHRENINFLINYFSKKSNTDVNNIHSFLNTPKASPYIKKERKQLINIHQLNYIKKKILFCEICKNIDHVTKNCHLQCRRQSCINDRYHNYQKCPKLNKDK